MLLSGRLLAAVVLLSGVATLVAYHESMQDFKRVCSQR